MWERGQAAGGGEGGTPTAPVSDDQLCLLLTFASIKLMACFHPNVVFAGWPDRTRLGAAGTRCHTFNIQRHLPTSNSSSVSKPGGHRIGKRHKVDVFLIVVDPSFDHWFPFSGNQSLAVIASERRVILLRRNPARIGRVTRGRFAIDYGPYSFAMDDG